MLDKSLSKLFPGFHPSFLYTFSSEAYDSQVTRARHTSYVVCFLQPVSRKILRKKFEKSVTLFSTYALLPSGDLKTFGQGESETVSFYLATFSCIGLGFFHLVFSLVQKSDHILNFCKILMSCGKEFHGLTFNSVKK